MFLKFVDELRVIGMAVLCLGIAGCASMVMGPPAAPIAQPTELVAPTIDVTGVWKGHAMVGVNYQLPYTLPLKQEQSVVTGTVDMATRDYAYTGQHEVEGVVSGDTLYYHGTQFVKRQQGFCMTTAKLTRLESSGTSALFGAYELLVHPNGCPLYRSLTGIVDVERAK